MILLYPPVSKPCEPPAGIARLSGALSLYGVRHRILDANLEALLYIMNCQQIASGRQSDKWTVRAIRNALNNYASLRDANTYHHFEHYKRAVVDLNRAVEMSIHSGITLNLANYRHQELSPLKSGDLIRAAEQHAYNPFYPYFKKRLLDLKKKEGFRVIGFSLNYLSQALCTFAMIGFLRETFPDVTLILGGGLVTSWMKSPDWHNPFGGLIDHMIAGPGESPLLSMIGIESNEQNHFTPDYDSLPLNDYLAPGRIIPYSASSGCYWNRCSFCPERAEKNPYIPRPADKATADMHKLIMKTKPSLVHILDNSMSTALLKQLADHPLGVPWYGFARISSYLTDIDFCMALKHSGCTMLKLGLESGDQAVLDHMKKGIDLERASLALKTLKKAGIASYVYLLFGTPPETLPAARRTLAFVVKHKDEISFLNLAIFNMPVCGPEAQEFKTNSFYEGDLSLYTNFSHPEGWDRKQVRQFLNNEFKKHRAVAEILKKDPPIFTSNHAPFLVMNH